MKGVVRYFCSTEYIRLPAGRLRLNGLADNHGSSVGPYNHVCELIEWTDLARAVMPRSGSRLAVSHSCSYRACKGLI